MSDSLPPPLDPAPPESAPPTASLAPSHDELTLSFDGRTWAYFRVWLVAQLLTLLTLGLFAPWASLRCRRFLWAHTRLGVEAFEYRGRPLAVGGVLLLTTVLPSVWLYAASRAFVAAPFMFASWMLACPWLVAFEARFHARNTWHAGRRLKLSVRYAHVLNALLPPLGSCFLLLMPLALLSPRLLSLSSPGAWLLAGFVGLVLLGTVLFARVRMFNAICRSARLGSLACVPQYRLADEVWIFWHGLAAALSYALLAPWAELCAHERQLSRLRVITADGGLESVREFSLDQTWA